MIYLFAEENDPCKTPESLPSKNLRKLSDEEEEEHKFTEYMIGLLLSRNEKKIKEVCEERGIVYGKKKYAGESVETNEEIQAEIKAESVPHQFPENVSNKSNFREGYRIKMDNIAKTSFESKSKSENIKQVKTNESDNKKKIIPLK